MARAVATATGKRADDMPSLSRQQKEERVREREMHMRGKAGRLTRTKAKQKKEQDTKAACHQTPVAR